MSKLTNVTGLTVAFAQVVLLRGTAPTGLVRLFECVALSQRCNCGSRKIATKKSCRMATDLYF